MNWKINEFLKTLKSFNLHHLFHDNADGYGYGGSYDGGYSGGRGGARGKGTP